MHFWSSVFLILLVVLPVTWILMKSVLMQTLRQLQQQYGLDPTRYNKVAYNEYYEQCQPFLEKLIWFQLRISTYGIHVLEYLTQKLQSLRRVYEAEIADLRIPPFYNSTILEAVDSVSLK